MRGFAIVAIVTLAACGGPRKPAASPSADAGAVPLVGLERASFGDSVDRISAAFPGAYSEGDRVWLEQAEVEGVPAVVMFDFVDGALRSLTVAFGVECDLLDAIGEQLDGSLGKRTSAEAGIAAWSRAGWDLALYCATGAAGDFPRLDVRPAATWLLL